MDGVGRNLPRTNPALSPLFTRGFCRAALCCCTLQRTVAVANTADNTQVRSDAFYSNRHITSFVLYPVPLLTQPCHLLALLLQLWSRQTLPMIFPIETNPQHHQIPLLIPLLNACSVYHLFPCLIPCLQINYICLHWTPSCHLLAESPERSRRWRICSGCAWFWRDLKLNSLFPLQSQSNFTAAPCCWGAGSLFSKPKEYIHWLLWSVMARRGPRDTSDCRLVPKTAPTQERRERAPGRSGWAGRRGIARMLCCWWCQTWAASATWAWWGTFVLSGLCVTEVLKQSQEQPSASLKIFHLCLLSHTCPWAGFDPTASITSSSFTFCLSY